MNAPICPINKGQPATNPRGTPTTLLPTIPVATDLPSLIRAVNIIRDILRSLTTSLTVNNTYLPQQPRDPKILPNRTYIMSPFPDWYQVKKKTVEGFVYYKSKSGRDADQRTYIVRTNEVEFRNNQQDEDQSFYWRYTKNLDSTYGKQGPAFYEDFFERVVNVHWSRTGVFSFAGYIGLDVAPPPGEFAGSVPHFTWLGGTSKNGDDWQSDRQEEGFAFFCCVRGKVPSKSADDLSEGTGSYRTVAAGNVIVGPYDFGPGYVLNYGAVPAAGSSFDDGQTWADGGLPKQEHILKPPNPHTGEGADSAQGNADAVAYDPVKQVFYVGARLIFVKGSDIYWEDRLFEGSGSGFSQLYSKRRALSTPFPGYQWPAPGRALKPEERLRVADSTGITKASSTKLLVVSFTSAQRAEYVDTQGKRTYVSVNAAGDGIMLGDKDISVPGIEIVNSVCGGNKHIVVVGRMDNDTRTGPITYVSDDDGKSWGQQLAGHVNDNPGPKDRDGGGSNGACSFSPS